MSDDEKKDEPDPTIKQVLKIDDGENGEVVVRHLSSSSFIPSKIKSDNDLISLLCTMRSISHVIQQIMERANPCGPGPRDCAVAVKVAEAWIGLKNQINMGLEELVNRGIKLPFDRIDEMPYPGAGNVVPFVIPPGKERIH
jgi:hypothetical protein